MTQQGLISNREADKAYYANLHLTSGNTESIDSPNTEIESETTTETSSSQATTKANHKVSHSSSPNKFSVDE